MNQQKRKVLIIEDETDISRIVKEYLNTNGYEAASADNGIDGLKMMELLSPDFIILDIMLPDMDGIELCRKIRERNNIPNLILSARGSDTDKVLGLGFGADDYMTKPFSLRLGTIMIDKKAYRVTVDGKEVALSAKEFELLHYLSSHKNQVFSKIQFLDAIWGYTTYGDENSVTVYIRRLREKIEVDPSNPTYIKTVWGIGYKFSVD
jgi:two-component system response regulator VicR